MLLGTRNNKRLHQLELLYFSCLCLRETDWQTAVHTGWQIWGTGNISYGQSTASKPSISAALCWGPVWQVHVELLEVQIYSLRGRLLKGGHMTRGIIYVQLQFWKNASSRRIRDKADFFNLFFFSHGSFFIRVECPVITVLLSEYFLED